MLLDRSCRAGKMFAGASEDDASSTARLLIIIVEVIRSTSFSMHNTRVIAVCPNCHITIA